MGFIFSKFSKLGRGAKPPNPQPPSVAGANQLFEPTHSFWAGYATGCLQSRTILLFNFIGTFGDSIYFFIR